MNSISLKTFLLLNVVLLLIGCGGSSGDDAVEVNYEVPELTDDGWKVSSASEVGIINNFNRDKVHDLRSAAKSITSALVGIAIDQGSIKDVNKPVFPSFANEYSDIDERVDGKLYTPNGAYNEVLLKNQ